MSHVQLSSSARERLVARRTFPLHRRTSACRNLFGPVDHEELSRDTKAKLRELMERDQQRWNFNFGTSTPMTGDYEWEAVPADKIPAFYHDTVNRSPSSDSAVPESPAVNVLERLTVPESSTSAPSPAGVNQEKRVDKVKSGTQSPAPCVRRKTTSAPDRVNNTCVTDFFVKRKRAGDDTSVSCHLSTSPVPAEQTPRKRIR
ncbi:cyclin-dependent kinase inhibitor 1C [Austrofundulus limnaeus]|uniref:Cyclin-dependent kinase inhibitor 1C n=1 Tax=Austrofundulus limnaeus TaxID=52670 RepID=A0A2I4D2F9_AUSLI|nr:PREDICTED: cyclin-dependent kinase inhibitor 1C-like [Austrofundulus limnaeus]